MKAGDFRFISNDDNWDRCAKVRHRTIKDKNGKRQVTQIVIEYTCYDPLLVETLEGKWVKSHTDGEWDIYKRVDKELE